MPVEPRPEPVGLVAHDLRHLLSLLACELRLTRDRLGELPAPERLRTLHALLAHLDTGLSGLGAALGGDPPARGGEAPAGAPLADRAELVAALWERFLRAGRLVPGQAELVLERPLLWPGAPLRWQSLLLNLLSNACAAAPAGPVSLRADAEGIVLRNGGRLPPANLVAALRRGEAPAPGADGRGQGLGLILAAQRALGLHLEITVDARTGWVELACLRAPRSAPALLLCEDDAALRELLAELLRSEGFRVRTCATAAAVAPAAGCFAALIADLHLPDAGGDRLLAAWRAADPALFTVLLTGDSAAAARSWPGVDAVLLKPGLGRLRELLAPLRRRQASGR